MSMVFLSHHTKQLPLFERSVPSMIVPFVTYGLKFNDTNQVKRFISLMFGQQHTAFHVYRQTMMSTTFLLNHKPDLKIADMQFKRPDLKILTVPQYNVLYCTFMWSGIMLIHLNSADTDV